MAVLMWALGIASPAFAQTTVIRVNTGGGAYTDSNGNVWSADTGYNTGGPAVDTGAVAGTNDPELYRTSRWDDSPAPELQYSFTVPNGWYEVRLHFADMTVPAWLPGNRVFDVQIEGATVLPRLDITAEVGHAVALIKTFNVRVTDGQLDIRFLHTPANHPIINALEILSSDKPTTPLALTASIASATQVNLAWQSSSDDQGAPGYSVERCQGAGCTNFTQIATAATTSYSDGGLSSSTIYRYRVRARDGTGNESSPSLVATGTTASSGAFSTLRVNSGGPSYTDTSGNVWVADTGFNTGGIANESGTVIGTSDPTLYMTTRWDDSPAPELEYTFNAPIGWYQVNLLFANMYNYNVGRRVFSIQVEGSTVFPNVDLTAEVGNYVATTKTTTVKVTDGQLNIRFLHTAADHPVISAIEVVQQSGYDFQAPAVPTSLSGTAISSSRIDVTWNAATDNVGVTGYRLERCRDAGCADFVEIASPATTAFSNTGLSSGTVYRYRVRSVDAAGNFSAYSPAQAISTFTGGGGTQAPGAPASLSATGYSAVRIDLNWTAATDDTGVVSYALERCYGAGCTNFTLLTRVFATTSYSDVTVAGGVTYRYRLRAFDADGNDGPYSPVATATTPLTTGTAGSTTYQYDSFGRLKQVTVVPN